MSSTPLAGGRNSDTCASGGNVLESVGCGGRIGTEVNGDKIILCCLGDRGAEITYHDIEKEGGGAQSHGDLRSPSAPLALYSSCSGVRCGCLE